MARVILRRRLPIVVLCVGLSGLGWSAADAQVAPVSRTPSSAARGQDAAAPAGGARLPASQQFAAVRERAIEQILLSARGGDPFLRANAVEAIQPLPNRALPMAQLGLTDEHPAVRFAALVTVGELGFENLREAVERAQGDPSPSVRAAAMVATRQLGGEADLTPLATMLMSPDPGLRANVAMLLGRLGDRSAAPMMLELSQTPMRRASEVEQSLTRLQIGEALVQLGNETPLDAIRAAAYSNHDEVRVLAVQTMGRLGDRRMQPALRQMMLQGAPNPGPIELRLAAAEALARMGSSDGLPVMRQAAQSTLATVRAQAAFALGRLQDPEAARALVELLDDASEQVRLSAAAAILRAMADDGAYRS